LLFNSSNSIEAIRATVDGLGRPILTQKKQGPSASYYDTVETDYDTVGRVAKATLPFSSTAGATSSSAKGVTYTYDALGRVLTASDSGGGVVTYSYSSNTAY
jgi:YD repeat-containing protein